MMLTADQITTDFVLDLAKTADECELDYGDPVGETLRILVAERDRLQKAQRAAYLRGLHDGLKAFEDGITQATDAIRALAKEGGE